MLLRFNSCVEQVLDSCLLVKFRRDMSNVEDLIHEEILPTYYMFSCSISRQILHVITGLTFLASVASASLLLPAEYVFSFFVQRCLTHLRSPTPREVSASDGDEVLAVSASIAFVLHVFGDLRCGGPASI